MIMRACLKTFVCSSTFTWFSWLAAPDRPACGTELQTMADAPRPSFQTCSENRAAVYGAGASGHLCVAPGSARPSAVARKPWRGEPLSVVEKGRRLLPPGGTVTESRAACPIVAGYARFDVRVCPPPTANCPDMPACARLCPLVPACAHINNFFGVCPSSSRSERDYEGWTHDQYREGDMLKVLAHGQYRGGDMLKHGLQTPDRLKHGLQTGWRARL